MIVLILVIIQIILYFANLTGVMNLNFFETYMPTILLLTYAIGYLLFEFLKSEVKK